MSKVKDMKIKTRLIIAFILVVILASVSGIYSVIYTGKVNEEYSFAIKNYGFGQGDVGKVMACFGSVNVSVHDVIGYVDPEDQAAAQKLYDTQIAKMDGYFAGLEATLVSNEVKSLFDTAKQAWAKYVPLAEELMKEGDTTDVEVVSQVQKRVVTELDPLYNTIYNSLTDVMFDKVDDGNEVEATLSKGITQTRIFVIILIIVSFVICFVLSSVISRSIANPIQKFAERLKGLAAGDLKSPVPEYDGKDECGVLAESTEIIVNGLTSIIEDQKYLLVQMAEGNFDIRSKVTELYIGDFEELLLAIRKINHMLSGALTQINQCSEQVSTSSGQVSSAAQNLSQSSTEQASSVDGLANTIEEISAQIKNNAANAVLASEKAENVGSEMEKSNSKMRNMINAMTEISNSSNEIGKIIKTIEDIAFQTNILALNAAVEAARAGEAGKGFAVVADEVGSLANKSAEASKNTAQLIEASIQAVNKGTAIADETAASLTLAADGVKDVVEAVEKISAASSEQAKSVEAVTQSMEQIATVVQTNSATAEESAAASEELFSQAQILEDLVSKFELRKEDTGYTGPSKRTVAGTAGKKEASGSGNAGQGSYDNWQSTTSSYDGGKY